mmetsp:Transcript_12062/g.18658  ORF Transcript_12062/g.18658 Transcript_12062/m.18658 type:complete len:553 (+) Transcript_12062:16-1674(+)
MTIGNPAMTTTEPISHVSESRSAIFSSAGDNKTSSPPAFVEIVLSRPAYRLGGTVVGTVRLSPGPLSNISPRDLFHSAQVYASGRCRIDSRWHNVKRCANVYGTHPLLDSLIDDRVENIAAQANEEEFVLSSSSATKTVSRDGATVCFWATNVVNLLELVERDVGCWDDVKPQSLKVCVKEQTDEEGKDEPILDDEDHKNVSAPDQSLRTSRSSPPLEHQQISFTFRIDLPTDIPHTVTATTCRYFYSVVLCGKTTEGKLFVVNAPFTVLTALQQESNDSAAHERVKLGSCSAVAHSVGLPCHISATELDRPEGQITVNRNVGLCSTISRGNVQTLRVADQFGTPCCMLTAIGASITSPGGRIVLHFDFPGINVENDGSNTNTWLRCQQVSCCLEGEEVATREDGSRKKSRSFLFDTAHEVVEIGFTERISLDLALPLDCPCTVKTDLLDISLRCTVDLTVEQSDGGGGYSNLRLELPCKIVHSAYADELENETDDDLNKNASLEKLMLGSTNESLDTERQQLNQLRTNDILDDLKILSIRMIDNCGLREQV